MLSTEEDIISAGASREKEDEQSTCNFVERFKDLFRKGAEWPDAAEKCYEEDKGFKDKVTLKLSEVPGVSKEEVYVSALVDLLLIEKLDDIHQALVHLLNSDSVIDLDSQLLELMTKELFDRALKNRDTSALQIFQNGDHDNSLFHLAVVKDNIKLVREMLEFAKKADISRPKDFGQAEVRDAVLTESCEIVKLLLDEGTDVWAVDDDGRTYLHLAASIGGESMKTLLEFESGLLNKPDKEGKTPLHYAAYYGSKASADFLISQGADINAIDSQKQTPLDTAREGNFKVQIVQLDTLEVPVEETDYHDANQLEEAPGQSDVNSTQNRRITRSNGGFSASFSDTTPSKEELKRILKVVKDYPKLVRKLGVSEHILKQRGPNPGLTALLHWTNNSETPTRKYLLECVEEIMGAGSEGVAKLRAEFK